MTDQTGERTVSVRGRPTSITLQCPHCDEWGETKLGDRQARILAIQLLASVDDIGLELLWPVMPVAK